MENNDDRIIIAIFGAFALGFITLAIISLTGTLGGCATPGHETWTCTICTSPTDAGVDHVAP